MEHQLHCLLLEEIKKTQLKTSEVARVLMESLSLGREAAYRRLRGDVPFTLQEAAVIAKKLSISLDGLIGVNLEKSKTLRIKLPDFIHLNENGRHMFSDFIEFFESISHLKTTETGAVTNALPQEISSNYALISKLNIFRWQYYYCYENRVPFKDLAVSDFVMDHLKKQYVLAKNFKETYYVFDRRIFIRLVKEIEYFESIGLIDAQSVQDIRDELLDLVAYLEELSITGEFPETGNKVSLYITDIEVPFSCAYVKANEVEYTLMKTFIMTSVTSLDRELFTKIREWVFSSIRASTLITKSSDIERIAFFGRQRELIGALH